MHQTEADLIKALHELSSGIMSSATDDFLQKLRKPLSPNLAPVYLYVRNFDAEMANSDVFVELDSLKKVYCSLDIGDHKSLESLSVLKNLVLKNKCKVMLISNISSKLVNGSTGYVKQLCDDSCIVSFDGVGDVPIKQQVFSVYSQEQGCNIATRKQLPLWFAYALTMHKAQGMTLDSAVVDVRFASQAGQVATAIGRVRSPSFVQVRNLSQLQTVEQPQEVFDFSASLLANDTNPSADWLCCRNRIIPDSYWSSLRWKTYRIWKPWYSQWWFLWKSYTSDNAWPWSTCWGCHWDKNLSSTFGRMLYYAFFTL